MLPFSSWPRPKRPVWASDFLPPKADFSVCLCCPPFYASDGRNPFFWVKLSVSFSSNVRTLQIWPQNPFLEEISLTIERAVPLVPQSCTLIHALSPCWSWCHGLMCYRKCVCLVESVTSSSSSHLPLLTGLYARSCLCSCYDWVCTVGSFRHLLVDNLKQKLFLNRQ